MGAKLHKHADYRAAFPALSHLNHSVTSNRDTTYNCIAWALGDTSRWWWPDPMGVRYWPPGILRQENVPAFDAMLASLGFKECVRRTLEKGIEKVALFVVGGMPKHMAKQTAKGKWSSKLGEEYDIEHVLDAVSGPAYGTVYKIYCRPTKI